MILAERVKSVSSDDYIFRFIDERSLKTKLVYWTVTPDIERTLFVDGKTITLTATPAIIDGISYENVNQIKYNDNRSIQEGSLFGRNKKLFTTTVENDADNITDNGTYIIFNASDKVTNLPVTDKCILQVELSYWSKVSSDIKQTCIRADDAAEWVRYRKWDGWTSWTKRVTLSTSSGTITTFAGGITGTVNYTITSVGGVKFANVHFDLQNITIKTYLRIIESGLPIPVNNGNVQLQSTNPSDPGKYKKFIILAYGLTLVPDPAYADVSSDYRFAGSVTYQCD